MLTLAQLLHLCLLANLSVFFLFYELLQLLVFAEEALCLVGDEIAKYFEGVFCGDWLLLKDFSNTRQFLSDFFDFSGSVLQAFFVLAEAILGLLKLVLSLLKALRVHFAHRHL